MLAERSHRGRDPAPHDRAVVGRNSLRTRSVPLVLVVDDERAAAEEVCRLLADIGCATRVVHTLARAREFLGAIEPDCVVLDLTFTDGDARELLVTLARRRAAPAAVVLSAQPRGAQVAASFGLPLVAKPIDPDHFVAAVQVAMDTRITPAEPRQS